PDETKALDGVSLRMADAEHLVVLGTNGSGKSTLLNALAGTFPLDEGRVVLDGRDLSSWPEHHRARLMGRVFQNPFTGTAPGMSVAENLALASRRGLPRGLDRAVSRGALKEFRERVKSLKMGLEDRLDSPVGALSGGQRQALTLLMATWRKPSLLLLDEHTAALDPKTAQLVIGLTERLIRDGGLTALMVTHSLAQAVSLGDRLIMMHRGRVVYDLSREEKRRLQADELWALFNEVRRKEQMDPAVGELLSRQYV
ncbi:MAG: ATP-binding cassette domain-containing protein, partial [Elusimicrobia bacterium]|nr:ATP-binding cassette domain-containing protein [Elusimicrobiota bacterium]